MAEMTADLAEKLLRDHAKDLPEDIAQELIWVANFVTAAEDRRKFDESAYRVNMNVVRSTNKDLKKLIEQQAAEIELLRCCGNCAYYRESSGNCYHSKPVRPHEADGGCADSVATMGGRLDYVKRMLGHAKRVASTEPRTYGQNDRDSGIARSRIGGKAMICDDCQKQSECHFVPQGDLCNNFFPVENRPTGLKHDIGKPPITLLDRDFLEGTAQVMRFGAEKYDRYNWCGGISHTRLADAAMRHLIAWTSGEDIDPESGLPHIDHASASLNMLRGTQRLHPGMDDRYRPRKQEES